VVVPALAHDATRGEVETVWRASFETESAIAQQAVEALAWIDPSKDVRALHESYVAASKEFSDALNEYQDRRLEFIAEGRYDEVPQATRLEDAAKSVVDRCLELQVKATDFGFDLACSPPTP